MLEKTPEQKRDDLLKHIADLHHVSAERAQEILVVMTARNVSAAGAIAILESQSWHEEQLAGRAANEAAHKASLKKPAHVASPATPAAKVSP